MIGPAPRASRLAARCAAVALAVGAGLPASATTLFEIQPGSTFTYFVGGFDAVPDCDGNDDMQCDFGLSGTFEFNGDAITAADLTLSSPVTVDPVLPGQITTAERLEAFLEDLTWALAPPFPPTAVYDVTNFPGPGSLTLAITESPVGGATGILTGGYDSRPFDGDGVEFNATIREVPEPGACVMLLLGFATGAFRRR